MVRATGQISWLPSVFHVLARHIGFSYGGTRNARSVRQPDTSAGRVVCRVIGNV